jgi:hypothetical protein
MEGARYALNKRTGNTALAEYSIRNVAGFGRQEYSCLECGEKLILKKGDIKKPHFAHEAQDKVCSYYSKSVADLDERTKIKHNERIHQIAIKELKKLLENDYKINPMRRCSAKGGCKNYTTDVVQLEHKHSHTVYKTEEPIMHDGKKRILDLVRIDEGEIKYIFEILDCHRTTEDSRPPEYEWFEIYADDVIKIRSEIDSMYYDITEGIEIDCQREIFKCRDCFEAEKQLLQKRERERIERLLKLEEERIVEEERNRIKLLELAEKERLRLIEIERKQAEELERNKIKELAEKARLLKIEEERKQVEERQRIKLKELAEKQLKDQEEERQKKIAREWNERIQSQRRQEQFAREEVERQQRRVREERERKERRAREEQERQEERAREEQERKEQRIIEEREQKELENLNKKCKGCNINQCKCKAPHFTTNEHKVIWCTDCKKGKCMCKHIDKFFNKV